VSYDYFLFARPAPGDGLTLDGLGDATAIGALDQVKAAISKTFPATRWEASRHDPRAWFGLQGPPEFLLTTEVDGGITSFQSCRIERAEVLLLARQLHLVVFDPQSGEILAE
jgi:hypothetical protein